MADQLAGELIVFQRADNPPFVVGMELRRRQRIDLLQPRVERCDTDVAELFFHLRAEFPVGSRSRE